MTAQHTPGTWKIRHDYLTPYGMALSVEIESDGIRTVIARLNPALIAEEHGGSNEANARLIAAAPALLAALERARDHLMMSGVRQTDAPEALAQARAALAAAKGGT